MSEPKTELRPRNRGFTPARKPFPMPPNLQRMFDRGIADLAQPFKGVTTDGTLAPGLFKLQKTGMSLQPVVDAAKAYLQALTPTQRATTSFELGSDAWRSWSNVHPYLMRHGLCMADLDAAQRDAALGLLRASMSAAGYTLARDVMKLNEHILEITGRPEEYGEWLYWMSIMGTPSASEPWGWQIDGHHLIVNCFMIGDQIVLTPNFMGSEPVVAASGKYKGTRVFAAEEEEGFSMMSALTPEQRRCATIGEKLPFDVVATAGNDNLVMPAAGIRYGDLAQEQQERLLGLIAVYTSRIRPGHAEIEFDAVKRHLEATSFAWIGAFDPASPFYYRVMSPVVLIEFDHQSGIALDNDEPTRNHIHTLVRTPNGNDYGRDLLRQHYERHDHSHPHSPHRRGRE
jgi:hypothetical protein